jgi:hypothetical protein
MRRAAGIDQDKLAVEDHRLRDCRRAMPPVEQMRLVNALDAVKDQESRSTRINEDRGERAAILAVRDIRLCR